MDPSLRTRINRRLSVKMRAWAEERRCPGCHRKGAMLTYPSEDFVLRKCRFCGFEKGKLV